MKDWPIAEAKPNFNIFCKITGFFPQNLNPEVNSPVTKAIAAAMTAMNALVQNMKS